MCCHYPFQSWAPVSVYFVFTITDLSSVRQIDQPQLYVLEVLVLLIVPFPELKREVEVELQLELEVELKVELKVELELELELPHFQASSKLIKSNSFISTI